MLKLNGTLQDVFAPVRHQTIAREVRHYLSKVEPRPSFERPDLDDMIFASIRFAETLGIDKVSAHKRFAYLWVLSEGQLADTAEAVDFIRFGGPDPNAQVEALMGHTLDAIRNDPRGRTA